MIHPAYGVYAHCKAAGMSAKFREKLKKALAPSEDRTHDPWFTRPVL